MSKHTITELHQLQGLSLNEKIERTKARIRQWVEHYGVDGCYVSFSGGKDSLVLLHLARSLYPDIKAVFLDTSLEFPELREFVKTFDNVEFLKPKMNFRQVIEKYGYPVISKEVTECVYGARIYLTTLLNEETISRQSVSQSVSQPVTAPVCTVLPKNMRNRRIRKEENRGVLHQTSMLIGIK